MSSVEEYKRKCDEFQVLLGELGDQLERVTGFVQRTSRLTGSRLVQILTLGALEQGNISLRGFCRVAAKLGIEISEPGLHQRLNATAVTLLRQMSQVWITHKSEGVLKAVFAPFDHVYLIDSTEIRLPDTMQAVFRGTRTASSLKVQLAYEYKQGHIEAFEMEAGCQPDQRSTVIETVAEAGDLVLFDLGYFDQTRFKHLNDKGVCFVSRLQTQAGLYSHQTGGRALSVLDVVRGCGTRGEQRYYLGSRARVPVRVLYYRLPDEVIAQRRRNAHAAARRRGQTCSQHTLACLEWLVFITNAPPDGLTLDQVADVYRVRWQIELVFKVWKSEMQLPCLGAWRPERILVQLYARLLGLLFFHRLVENTPPSDKGEFSLIQAYQLLRTEVSRLIRIVKHAFRGLLSFLTDFTSGLRRFAVKTKRRKSPSTLDRLLAVGA